jgi:hypothetical protein
MGSCLNDELTLHVEFRDDWRKPADYNIKKLSAGYVLYETIGKGECWSRIDCLQIQRGSFRIEIHAKELEKPFHSWGKELKLLHDFFSKIPEKFAESLCNTNNGAYFIFTLGKNYRDPNNGKEFRKYKNWYYFLFDIGFEDLLYVPGFRKMVNRKDIMQETSRSDGVETIMFFKTFSIKNIKETFLKFNRLLEIAIQLQVKLNKIYSSFAEALSWK